MIRRWSWSFPEGGVRSLQLSYELSREADVHRVQVLPDCPECVKIFVLFRDLVFGDVPAINSHPHH